MTVTKPDGGDRGEPQAGEHRRHRERQLDLEQAPGGAVAHPGRGVEHGLVHAIEPDEHRAHEDVQVVGDERDQRRPDAEQAEPGGEEGEGGQRRDRVEHSGHAQHRPSPPLMTVDVEAEREREGHGDAEGQPRVPEVLLERGEDLAGVPGDPVPPDPGILPPEDHGPRSRSRVTCRMASRLSKVMVQTSSPSSTLDRHASNATAFGDVSDLPAHRFRPTSRYRRLP